MTGLIWFITALAFALLLISALGLLRLKDALARQHAVTKAATLSLTLLIVAMILYAYTMNWNAEWYGKLLLLMIILLITLPLASHALARSSYQEEQKKSP